MTYENESSIANNPDFKKIGTYFGKHNAEFIARLNTNHFTEVVITYAYTKFGKYDFYAVWVKEKSLLEVLKEQENAQCVVW